MTSARFEVAIDQNAAIAFATLSGDWNPLHTDAAHAAGTPYRRPVLHGAFSAGLVSRMAGMFLPGTDCLLHTMQLRFLAPIVPPARLAVAGHIAAESGTSGRVDVVIDDQDTGVRYVEASYEFGRHELGGGHGGAETALPRTPRHGRDESVVLVTGASGGLGRAVCAALGDGAVGLSRVASGALVAVPDLERLPEELEAILDGRRVSGIVHCAWPAPDNVPLSQLTEIAPAIEHFIAAPLRQMVGLAKALKAHGTPDAMLLYVGSAFADPGRHNYRMPLYSIGKALIPSLTRALALDLGVSGQRCAAVVFDVIDAGMNQRMTKSARLAHANRLPTGTLPTADDAAAQVRWILENRSALASGAVLSLTGGAIP